MSTRDDRYFAAVCLAQMILEQPPGDDDRLLSEAVSLLTAEVHAGRQNQKAFSQEQFSMKVGPALRAVEET